MLKSNKSQVLEIAIFLFLFFTISSCAHKSGHNSPNDHSGHNVTMSHDETEAQNVRRVGGHTKVSMRKEGGVYLIPITVNGLNLDFIFDTGASSISLSAAEATVMVRQGKISDDDIVGQEQFCDAVGNVSVGTVIRLRSVQIGDITLENVEASVVDNIKAPLLLGQTALAKFGKVTIDYNNNTIEFNSQSIQGS